MKYQCKNCGFLHDRPLPTDGSHCKCGSAFQFTELSDEPKPQEPKHNHYFRIFKGVRIDFYFIMSLFGVTDQAVGHAIKKLMFAGVRGAKDQKKDLQEAIDSIQRKLEILQVLEEESASSIKSKIEIPEPLEWKNHAEGGLLALTLDYGYRVILDNPLAEKNKWALYINGNIQRYANTQEDAMEYAERHRKLCPKTPSSI